MIQQNNHRPFSDYTPYIEISHCIFVGKFFGIFATLSNSKLTNLSLSSVSNIRQDDTVSVLFWKALVQNSEYSYCLPKKTKKVTILLVCREPSKDVAARLVSASLSFSNMLKVSRVQSNRRRTSPPPKNGNINEYYMNEQVQVLMRWDSAHTGHLRKLHVALFHSWTNTSNPICQRKIWSGDTPQQLQLTLSLCEAQLTYVALR